MALAALDQYRLVMGHVVSHPGLQDAARAAWADHEEKEKKGERGVDLDLLPYLIRHGFALPESATARLKISESAADSEPDPLIVVCVQINDHSFCVTVQSPITITHL